MKKIILLILFIITCMGCSCKKNVKQEDKPTEKAVSNTKSIPQTLLVIY